MSSENEKKAITLRPKPYERALIKWHMLEYGSPTMTRTIFRALEELKDIKEDIKRLEKEGREIAAIRKDVIKPLRRW